MRKIIVSGFLAQDATKQISKQNREYVTFSIANHEYNDEKGVDGRPITRWFRITCLNPNQLSFASNLKKGSNVIVTGSLRDSIYQNQQGVWNISRDIMADSIDYNSSRQAEGQQPNGQFQNPSVGKVSNVPFPKAASMPEMPTVSSIPSGATVPQPQQPKAAVSQPTVAKANGNIPVPPKDVTADQAVDDLPF